MPVQHNLRHYSSFPGKGHRIFHFQVLLLLAFLCSEPRTVFIPHQLQNKVLWHFIKSLLSFISWRVQEHCCSAFLLHYILMSNSVFSLQDLPWSIRAEKNNQSAFTEIPSSCWLSINWNQEATAIKGFSSLQMRSCAAAAPRKAEGPGWNEGIFP